MKTTKTAITTTITIVLILVLTVGCAAKSRKIKTVSTKEIKTDYIFYPPLPNTPRYQYLKTFSDSKDVQKKKSKFFKFVVGGDEKKPRVIKKAYGVDIYNGVIYVCDVGGGVVGTFDLKNHQFDYIGMKGSGKLVKPVNLIIDRENKLLYVTDIGRKQVLCYTLDGGLVKSYGKKGQFEQPVDVDHVGNKLFVCDVKKHIIYVVDKGSGETLHTIGRVGSNEGELFHPTNICIVNDRLYVSDTSNFRIQVFDLKGKFLSTFGKVGRQPGEFARNKGIAVDKEGRIYVVDAAFENVQVFNQQFQLLLYMFGPGREKHNINLPAGIAVDYDNVKYFKKYLSPKFKAEYLLLVTSNFGHNKVNVYAFGSYKN